MTGAAGLPAPADQIAGMIFAVLLLAPDGTIAQANPAAEDMLGRSGARLFGCHPVSLLHIRDTAVGKRLAAPAAPMTARDVAVTIGTREAKVDLTLSPLVSEAGWGVLTIADAAQDRGQTLRAASRVPAILSHEIKNPLAAIRGAAQLLEKRSDEGQRALTQLVITEVDRIAALVDRMQTIGSERKIALQPCNIHEALHHARESFQVAHPGVEVVEQYDPSIPAIAAHHDSLVQVVLNLLNNAHDAAAVCNEPTLYMQTRYIHGMTVRAHSTDQPHHLPVELRIGDNGPGVPAELAVQMFDPFVTSKPNGEGLGLALVRKLVADMGGRVHYDRDERAGRTDIVIHLALAGGSN